MSPEEQAAYDEARTRWSEYESESAPLWEAGSTTADASALFQSYFVSPVWQQYLERLRTYEDAGVTVSGLPTVFWSVPGRIKLSDDGGSVVVRQCVDYSTQVVEQDGQAVDAIYGPVLRSATLDRVGDQPWLLLRITEPTTEDFKVCSQEGP